MELEPAAPADPAAAHCPMALTQRLPIGTPATRSRQRRRPTRCRPPVRRGRTGPGRLRRLGRVTLPGSWGALVLACLSFTPSLLPRGGLVQGLVWGITAAIGYGLGVVAAWIWRAFADRDARPPAELGVAGLPGECRGAAARVSFALGQYWQYEIRRLMGVTDYNLALVVASPVVAAAVFCLLILTGRGLRRVYRSAARLLRRWIGPRAAAPWAGSLVVGLTYLVVTGLLLDGFVTVADEAFSVRDTTTPEGVHQPTTGLRSGGPGSAGAVGLPRLPGADLHRPRPVTGRHRGGDAPPGSGAGQGLRRAWRPAADAESRAALAVQDLERAGGFQRKNLLVVTTTGSGWVDPAWSTPSSTSPTGTRRRSRSSTPTCRRGCPTWSTSPRLARPAAPCSTPSTTGGRSCRPAGARLFVAGESLGSFGGETAFSGEYDLRNRTVGTLFAGPPNFNTLFREFSDHRDPGQPGDPARLQGRAHRPVHQRPGAGDSPGRASPWHGSRVLYLMHPSDPIVWWSPQPDPRQAGLDRRAARQGRAREIVWIPFVTFWQVTADLPFSTGVPAGTATSTPASTSTGGTRSCNPQTSHPRSWRGSAVWSSDLD